ncbi:two-component sensor histidine kinase [Leucothrix pacifica]|uniref:Sensor protein n=2 Tax=Leucothrix pacifica TaxID=1247513 RepID=A0A317C3D0_9GAMM|nr:two-component sensor histidine kinase [Leucothrix pacifica]
MIFSRKPSMRRKLVLMFLGTTVAVHLILSAVAQKMTKSYFYDSESAHIENKFNGLNEKSSLDYTDPKAVKHFGKALINIWNLTDNKVTYQNSPILLPIESNNFFLKNDGDEYTSMWELEGNHYLSSSFFVNKENTLVLGLNVNHHIEFFEAVGTLMFWFTTIVSLLAGIYSAVIVNNGLKPLKKLEGYLARIRPGRLDIRVPKDELPEELENLAEVQNSMLDRLDLGFQRLSDFSTDIAHELRTPLTNMTTQMQVSLANDRSPDEYRDILGSNLEELERITKTINDTLYLAKAENSLLYKNNETLDLAKEMSQLIEYHNIIAEDKEIVIEFTGEGELYIDKHMFQRAMNNLLSNAIRHAHENTQICVKITHPNKSLGISISNIGDTISESTLPFIFDRFYRGDCSRENDSTTGAGLGLAITKSIIETYHGVISVTSKDGLTTFEILFPPPNSTS